MNAVLFTQSFDACVGHAGAESVTVGGKTYGVTKQEQNGKAVYRITDEAGKTHIVNAGDLTAAQAVKSYRKWL